MSLWRDVWHQFEQRLDENLLPALYAAASLDTASIREDLSGDSLVYANLREGRVPPGEDLDATAEVLIEKARKKAGAVGAAGGVAGAAGVPPEVLALLIQTLRLAQRLAVVYGFDPETDRGQMMLWRAMGAAYDVDMPEGQLGVRVRDLPSTMKHNMPPARQAAAWMTRRVVRRAVWQVAAKGIRLVPGLSTGVSAWAAQKRVQAQGRRMAEVLRRASEVHPGALLTVIEAEVLD
jgi:hypothetical protein